jgi:CheY-like chemotaxis protein
LEALDYLLGGAALPRLVLLDLHSPRLNGFEVLKRLRASERASHLPVVVFSASDEAFDEAECLRLRADRFIRKPVGFERLCETLGQLEREWLRSRP